MQNLAHFIWLGDLSTTTKKICCRLGVSSLSSWLPEIPIYFWVPDRLMAEASMLFDAYSNVRICSIDHLLTYSCTTHINPMQISSQLKMLELKPDTFTTYNPFIFQKDLLSIAIVAEYGGFFFDATVLFHEKPDLSLTTELKVIGSKDIAPELADVNAWVHESDVCVFAAAEPGNKTLLRTLALYNSREFNDISISAHLVSALAETYGEFPAPEQRTACSLWVQNRQLRSRIIISPDGKLNVEKISMATWHSADRSVKENAWDRILSYTFMICSQDFSKSHKFCELLLNDLDFRAFVVNATNSDFLNSWFFPFLICANQHIPEYASLGSSSLQTMLALAQANPHHIDKLTQLLFAETPLKSHW